jgi:hypothetical protein
MLGKVEEAIALKKNAISVFTPSAKHCLRSWVMLCRLLEDPVTWNWPAYFPLCYWLGKKELHKYLPQSVRKGCIAKRRSTGLC